jgi:hypothetical protein
MTRKKQELLPAVVATKIASDNPEPKGSTVPVYQGGFENSQPAQNPPALREAKRIKDSSFARLWKYLYEPDKAVDLTELEYDQLRRLSNVWDLLTGKILNDRKAVLAHVTWCKEKCMDISERTAYDDLKRAKFLYGDPRVNTPVFEKARISTIILGQIEQMKTISETGNTIARIEAAKAINQLTRRYNAVNGLEEDIKSAIPRPAITITFTSDTETLKRQAAELMNDLTIDVPHSEEKE